ncbi:hypothetical protein [Gilvimarinus sp. DA14]|uniref:hypothetical protein n=1 Tax=Gilvimarinus sp. DA14 TaxID=2956798 RepID=UPI0020B6B9CF|nr:hypothetical protein [Gilvimarinus sp. DA14]UTF60114.1 hypothetical protein NHM04_16825 [Gilvimarinus sp. DA14]
MNNAAQQKAIAAIEQGDWHGAHELVQDGNDSLSCLLHGYLHREEGDLANAAYWYRRARQSMPDNSLADELERIKTLAGE